MSTLTDLPRVPLEVAENIIDNLGRHVDSLRSCALTCRGWLPQARYQLLASIRIRSKEDISSIQDYLSTHPRLTVAVQKLTVWPHEAEKYLLAAVPVYFISRLPKLQHYTIRQPTTLDDTLTCFHPRTLRGVKAHLLVEELSLHNLVFRTSAELVQLLTALSRLRRLELERVRIEAARDTPAHVDHTARLHDKCRALTDLSVRCQAHSTCEAVTVHHSSRCLQIDDYTDLNVVDLTIKMSMSSLQTLRLVECSDFVGSTS